MTKSRITKDYDPGTRITPEEIKRRFPDVEPQAALRDFISYHLAHGTYSYDWDQTFLGWCSGRQYKADEKKRDTKQTDSMGLPLDGRKRATIGVSTEGDYGTRFLHALERRLGEGQDFDSAHAATIAELEGDENGN